VNSDHAHETAISSENNITGPSMDMLLPRPGLCKLGGGGWSAAHARQSGRIVGRRHRPWKARREGVPHSAIT